MGIANVAEKFSNDFAKNVEIIIQIIRMDFKWTKIIF